MRLLRVYLTIFFFSIVFFLYLSEVYLTYNIPKGNQLIKNLKIKEERYKKLTGNSFDLRTKIELYKDLQKKDSKVSLVISPKNFLNKENKLDVLAFSGISNSKTISCNENGYYQIYKSDRYGFNNPDREWLSNRVSYLLLGDSFAHGSCVNRPNDIASSLRAQTKKTSISLGYVGNGPLIQLATLKEYLPENVENIIWFYYEENDLIDLSTEINNSILIKYLNNYNFSQNLKEKQDDIDKYLTSNIKKNLNDIKLEEDYWRGYYSKKKVFLRFIRLDSFKRFIVSLKKNKNISSENEMIGNLEKILASAKQIAKTKNSNLYFVYLSGFNRYNSFFSDQYEFMNNYPKIIDMVNNLGISVIDIHAELFAKEKYPLDYFPFSQYGHYNEKGYKKISEIIYEAIK
tara:strand:+ start:2498 stop:3703 length:1206 start_codon:yes stop_codon:yes gene_type:complete